MRAAATILRELAAVLPQAANDGAVALEQAMVRANRIFTSGAGRSGLMLTAFTNRLMHLGLSAHRVGDVTSPAIRVGDLLIVASRSGSTAGPLANAHIAAASGAAVVAVTADPLSPWRSAQAPLLSLPLPHQYNRWDRCSSRHFS
ncbi:SIS domain-containing protein [Actinobaculum sp. 313]|uniref:SIS domain-containing protein n=1 Tax=Actinobaculum sp. 313 TaxID=2495645 RepID=UPI000D526225|nr:SIS domain-containing protein [Actinobaculum sp. 313]AWE41992.1 hypothetical protein DDD63_03610 [Actinobaculum sp. 313]